jgi:PAS domain-containing protein
MDCGATWLTKSSLNPRGKRVKTDFNNLLLNETPHPVVVTAADGTVAYRNRGAEAVFDYASGAEAIGRGRIVFTKSQTESGSFGYDAENYAANLSRDIAGTFSRHPSKWLKIMN